MTQSIRLAIVTLVVVGLASCGGARQLRAVAPRAAPSAGIESFGHLAVGSERRAVTATVVGYDRAIAADDGRAVCKYLAAPVRSQAIALLASRGRRPDPGCAQQLRLMYAHQLPATITALRHVAVGEVRVEGPRAFALLRQPGKPTEFFLVQEEQGRWRIGALGPSVLPSPPAQG